MPLEQNSSFTSESETLDSPEKIEHNCGIGLVYFFDQPGNPKPYLQAMGYSLQHRGQNGVGMGWGTDDQHMTRVVGDGLIDQAFTAQDWKDFDMANSCWGMIQARYTTAGKNNTQNLQPCEGEGALVEVNGNIPDKDGLLQYLSAEERSKIPKGASDTFIGTKVVSTLPGTWDERVRAFANLPEVLNAANNMFIGVGSEMYVLRSPKAINSFVVGKINNGMIFASETTALNKVGAEVTGEFPRGAVWKLDANGVHELEGERKDVQPARCVFEQVYFSAPESLAPPYWVTDPKDIKEWQSNFKMRFETGVKMGQHYPVPHAHMVIPMPDSGTPFASGYAAGMAKRGYYIPFVPAIIRPHYGPANKRSFIEAFGEEEGYDVINNLLTDKLNVIPDPGLFKDKVVIGADDSLMRGLTSRNKIEELRRMGAKEVHMRFGLSEVTHTCPYAVNIKTNEELLAAVCDGDWGKIADAIGADSVAFIGWEKLMQVLNGSKPIVIPEDPRDIFLANNACGGCLTGKYPAKIEAKEGTIFRSTRANYLIPTPSLQVA